VVRTFSYGRSDLEALILDRGIVIHQPSGIILTDRSVAYFPPEVGGQVTSMIPTSQSSQSLPPQAIGGWCAKATIQGG
jgi:hypothetical protein